MANDGRRRGTESYWATDVNDDKDPRWQVDLGRPVKVGRVVVVGYYGHQRYYGFTVEASKDGEHWEMLVDRRDNHDLSTRAGYTSLLTAREARYLRSGRRIIPPTPAAIWWRLWPFRNEMDP